MSDISILPKLDFKRSYAAMRLEELAKANRASCFHFEGRLQLEQPDAWLGEEPSVYQWSKGFLAEGKYSAFQSDHLMASFQPAHDGKWTTHEIMHNLLGFSWRPEASVFYNSLASRISESLPVALYYFFDEVGLQRCEKHRFSMSLHALRCPECEALAGSGLQGDFDTNSLEWKMGESFLEREFEAVKKSLKTGQVYENVFGGLNLTTDAMYYASNQQARLSDPLFAKLISAFYEPNKLVHSSVESLIERAGQILRDLKSGEKVSYDYNNVDLDTHHRIDVASRLVCMAKHLEGSPAFEAMNDLIFNTLTKPNSIDECVVAYEDLERKYELIPLEDMFSVGYKINDRLGFSQAQLWDGLLSQFPYSISQWQTHDEEDLAVVISEFSQAMTWERASIGKRFMDSMKNRIPSHLTDLFEKELLLEWNQESKPEYHYLQSISSELRWNSSLRYKKSGPEDWADLGLKLGAEFEELYILCLKTHKANNAQVFPLSFEEFEEIEKAIEERREPKIEQSLLNDLKREMFLVNRSWSL